MAAVNPPRIVRFEINSIPRPKPMGFLDPTPNLVATFDNGDRKELMSAVYVDEWVPAEGELIGLTEDEARAFLQRKDAEYLRRS